MKKLLLVALAAAGAVVAKKKMDEGKQRAGPLGRGHRHRRQGLTLRPRPPTAPTTGGLGAIGSAPALQAGG